MPVPVASWIPCGHVQSPIPQTCVQYRPEAQPSYWSEECMAGFDKVSGTVCCELGGRLFCFRVSQVSTAGPKESWSGCSWGLESSGAGARGVQVTPAAAPQLSQPYETQYYIWNSPQVSKMNQYGVWVKDAHLCVDLLRDSMLLDPGMDFSQLFSLFLAEPRLEGLKNPKLLPVFCQHLILVPGQEDMG